VFENRELMIKFGTKREEVDWEEEGRGSFVTCTVRYILLW